mgnify:CR=1 FL=1
MSKLLLLAGLRPFFALSFGGAPVAFAATTLLTGGLFVGTIDQVGRGARGA